MYLLLMISLAFIVSAICREIDHQRQPLASLTGTCPTCKATAESGWLACPECRTLLRVSCHRCGKQHDRWGDFCPWCGAASEAEDA